MGGSQDDALRSTEYEDPLPLLKELAVLSQCSPLKLNDQVGIQGSVQDFESSLSVQALVPLIEEIVNYACSDSTIPLEPMMPFQHGLWAVQANACALKIM